MRITFDDAVSKKIRDKLKPGDKLLLTEEDGVGPYSQHAMIHMMNQFTINIIGPDMSLDTYDDQIDSNLGPVYVKGYTKEDMDPNMTLKLNKTLNTMKLSGDVGNLDENVGFIDFTDPDSIKHNPAK